ncbi:MAG TPA: hypothetical protein VNN20_00075 [Thermodesulfobacteriota bacterium]|nr:hypothetical protein [Thermodesulfobacteriota bacterium]
MKQRTSIKGKEEAPSFFFLHPCGGGLRCGELIFIHPHPFGFAQDSVHPSLPTQVGK